MYGVRQIPLPFPNYVVFYNGNTEEPDESELLLSEAFLLPEQDSLPAVECRVRVLNINQGHNRQEDVRPAAADRTARIISIGSPSVHSITRSVNSS